MPKFKVDRQFGPFTWAGLSALRTLSFLKIGYIGAIGIPIAAYILRNAQSLGMDARLPVTLFWMYLGSMLLALGHLLNEIACPYLIKKFPALHEYRAQLAESFAYQATIRLARLENLRDSMRDTLRKDGKVPSEDQRGLAEDLADVVLAESKESVGREADALESDPATLWVQANESLFGLRGAIVALYVASALIIGFFSVRQFWIVLMATFGSGWVFPGN